WFPLRIFRRWFPRRRRTSLATHELSERGAVQTKHRSRFIFSIFLQYRRRPLFHHVREGGQRSGEAAIIKLENYSETYEYKNYQCGNYSQRRHYRGRGFCFCTERACAKRRARFDKLRDHARRAEPGTVADESRFVCAERCFVCRQRCVCRRRLADV